MTTLKHPWVPGPAKTKDGTDVTILTVTAKGNWPIVGLVHYSDKLDQPASWSYEGTGLPTPVGSYNLAPPEPPRLSGFVNVYASTLSTAYQTKAIADRNAAADRIACIDLSQHFEGEGLE